MQMRITRITKMVGTMIAMAMTGTKTTTTTRVMGTTTNMPRMDKAGVAAIRKKSQKLSVTSQ
jgi:hypothetical protein